MAQAKSRIITKLEIRNVASGGSVGNSAFGTANLELYNIGKDSKGISWKGNGVTLSDDQERYTNGTGEFEYTFDECQSSTGATEANILADIAAGNLFQIKETNLSGSLTFGGTTGVRIKLDIEPKDGIKIYKISGKKTELNRAALITEA